MDETELCIVEIKVCVKQMESRKASTVTSIDGLRRQIKFREDEIDITNRQIEHIRTGIALEEEQAAAIQAAIDNTKKKWDADHEIDWEA